MSGTELKTNDKVANTNPDQEGDPSMDTAAASLDARADALVAELRDMRSKVAEALGKSHAPSEAKVRAA